MKAIRPYWIPPTSDLRFDRLLPDGVTLITPTGDRPDVFMLAERWIGRQSYDGPLQWIVVDDGHEPTTVRLHQTYIHRQRRPDDPGHTLSVNLLAAMPHIRYDQVLIIEDDDWYATHYIETVVDRLQHFALVGEAYAIYYRLVSPMWKTFQNKRWASLAATAMRGAEALWDLHHACTYADSIDLALWRRFSGRKYVFGRRDKPLVVQFKGMPGRAGIGSHHAGGGDYALDDGCTRLTDWIGTDVEAYAPFMPAEPVVAE